MASRKSTPERSKITRERPLAYARRHKGDDGDPPPADKAAPEAKAEATKADAAIDATPAPAATPEAKAAPAAAAQEPAAITPPPPPAEPWPDATPEPMRPVAPPERATTLEMPAAAALGAPPPVPGAHTAAEDTTHMPPVKAIPPGAPTDPMRPPGRVPPGDSRSLRRGGEFALIYRVGSCVVTRFGTVGQRGQWRVVDYPTTSAASTAYAKECSRFVSDGFTDYRD